MIPLARHRWQISLQWSSDELQYLLVQQRRDTAEIVAADTINLFDGSSHESLARHIKAILTKHQVRRADAFIVLSRPHVDLLPIELPQASDEELPELVEIQVAQQLPDASSDAIIDYVTIHGDHPANRRILACIIKKPVLDFVNSLCAATRLKLSRLGVRTLASSAGTVDGTSLNAASLFVTVHHGEADLALVHENQLVLTRTVRLPTEDNDAVLASLAQEIQRTILLGGLALEEEDHHVVVYGLGESARTLRAQLQPRLACPVHHTTPVASALTKHQGLDRVTSILNNGSFAPLFGILPGAQSPLPQIDFLHPRRPPAKPNPWRRYALYGGIAASLLLAGTWAAYQDRTTQRDEIDMRTRQLAALKSQVDKLQKKQQLIDAVQRWQLDDITWLDELRDFVERFPSADQAVIEKLSIATDNRSTGIVSLQIRVSDPSQLEIFESRVRDASHTIDSKRVSEQDRRDGLPWQFESTIRVRPRDRDSYLTQFNSTSEEASPAPADNAAPNIPSPQSVNETH
jgi:hypothetical protein